MSCFFANSIRSGMRAISPSSRMISQITAAPFSPASFDRSTLPSVCPARTMTPPFWARRGKMCPGVTRSSGWASSATAARMVVARSAAEMPVVTPLRASMDTVKLVPNFEPLRRVIMGSCSASTSAGSRGRQIRPRPCVAMKLMISGVTCWAAMVRSPSFSRSSSSTRMIIRPLRISSMASSVLQMGMATSGYATPPRAGAAFWSLIRNAGYVPAVRQVPAVRHA